MFSNNMKKDFCCGSIRAQKKNTQVNSILETESIAALTLFFTHFYPQKNSSNWQRWLVDELEEEREKVHLKGKIEYKTGRESWPPFQ